MTFLRYDALSEAAMQTMNAIDHRGCAKDADARKWLAAHTSPPRVWDFNHAICCRCDCGNKWIHPDDKPVHCQRCGRKYLTVGNHGFWK